jgi:hypothetical protein
VNGPLTNTSHAHVVNASSASILVETFF